MLFSAEELGSVVAAGGAGHAVRTSAMQEPVSSSPAAAPHLEGNLVTLLHIKDPPGGYRRNFQLLKEPLTRRHCSRS